MKKYTLKIKVLENQFGIKIKKNCIVLGLDTASRTGICLAKSDNENVNFDVSFVSVNVKKIKDKDLRNQLRYEEFYKRFKNIIKSNQVVVIENVYYGGNAQTLILLSRIGAIAWVVAKDKGCSNIIWKTATQARKALGLPCNKKKHVVMEEVNKRLQFNVFKDDDIIDAIILALNGLIEEE